MDNSKLTTISGVYPTRLKRQATPCSSLSDASIIDRKRLKLQDTPVDNTSAPSSSEAAVDSTPELSNSEAAVDNTSELSNSEAISVDNTSEPSNRQVFSDSNYPTPSNSEAISINNSPDPLALVDTQNNIFTGTFEEWLELESSIPSPQSIPNNESSAPDNLLDPNGYPFVGTVSQWGRTPTYIPRDKKECEMGFVSFPCQRIVARCFQCRKPVANNRQPALTTFNPNCQTCYNAKAGTGTGETLPAIYWRLDSSNENGCGCVFQPELRSIWTGFDHGSDSHDSTKGTPVSPEARARAASVSSWLDGVEEVSE
ncbi:hypothetical protein NHQ30_004395 [Ciborinia camelliae]|nr:hypothetical protein NHQ30_004395 [Ciborinia camelliae]